jgi:hypothetical protein
MLFLWTVKQSFDFIDDYLCRKILEFYRWLSVRVVPSTKKYIWGLFPLKNLCWSFISYNVRLLFDMLKNKELDKTTQVVPCLIVKLFQGLDKFGGKRHDKNINFCPSLNHNTTFCPKYKLSKIPKYHLVHQISVMCCVVLSCVVLSSADHLTNQMHP